MDSTQLKQEFDTNWGVFRKFLSTHPLTVFWVTLVVGFVLGYLI